MRVAGFLWLVEAQLVVESAAIRLQPGLLALAIFWAGCHSLAADVLLGGAMMKEETQYFSPPPSEPQADEEPEAEQPRPGVFAHGTTAATAPGSRPDCARAACVAAEASARGQQLCLLWMRLC